MTAFADSSALVKLYADEPGSDKVRALRLPVVSAVARVEVPAALWRKARMRQLTPAHAGLLTTAFENDWYDGSETFLVVAASSGIFDEAARLAATRGLPAYDAVQLASALAARAADQSVDTMVCFGDDLRAAAAQEGFGVDVSR